MTVNQQNQRKRVIQISRLWYVTTAVHLWRFYFRYADADVTQFSEPSRLNYAAADRAIKKFNHEEVDLLRKYYLTNYGGYEDFKVINDFAVNNGIDSRMAWDIIKMANYEVIVERGLMDRRDVKTDAKAADVQRDCTGT